MFEETEGAVGIWRFVNAHNVFLVLFVGVGMTLMVIFDNAEDMDGTVEWSSAAGDHWAGEPQFCQDGDAQVMFKSMGDDERVHLSISEHHAILHGSLQYQWDPSECTITVRQLNEEGDGMLRGRCVADEFRVSWDLEYERCGETGRFDGP